MLEYYQSNDLLEYSNKQLINNGLLKVDEWTMITVVVDRSLTGNTYFYYNATLIDTRN